MDCFVWVMWIVGWRWGADRQRVCHHGFDAETRSRTVVLNKELETEQIGKSSPNV